MIEILLHLTEIFGFPILAYFTIFRLTEKSSYNSLMSSGYSSLASTDSKKSLAVITSLDARLRELETQLKIQKTDTARLVEWLDKRDRELIEIQARFVKALQVDERERKLEERQSRIIQLGENLRLITTKK